MNDSRKDDRLSVALVMRYREPTMLEPREGQCQNVSLSGMCILTQKPSPRGALIRFECVSGGPVEGIRGTARVVWQRSKSDPRGPAAMGVRFVRLEPGCREALEGLIVQLGGERKPSGAEQPPAPDAPPQKPATDRPGAATLISSPATASGVTQQGMGAARSRSMKYPTLRGMGIRSSQAPASRNGHSSPPPAKTDGDGEIRRRSSPRPPSLGVTLPGHSTTSSAPPFAASPSAPPPAPTEDPRNSSGLMRDHLDRTRRGQPSFSTPPPERDEPLAAGASWANEPARQGTGSDRPPRERKSDRPPRPGGIDDLRASPLPPPPEGEGGRRAERSRSLTPEPVDDETAARRRASRAAAAAAAAPALPAYDLDGGRRRNWLPWVVIGTGLLASWLMIRMFGSAPAGVPVSAPVEHTEEAPRAPEPAPNPAAAAANVAIAQPEQPGDLKAAGYTLEVASEPAGARVSAADQVVVAPAALELATLTAPIEVKGELDGYETSTLTVGPTDFQAKDGRYVHSIVLKLTARAPTAEAAPAAAAGAAAAQRPQQPAADAKKSDKKPAPPRRARPAPEAADRAGQTPVTPQIAQPPVPIEAPPPAATPTATEPAPATAPEAATDDEPKAAAGEAKPLDVALECLSRGDNLCVVSTLEGRAKTARELEVLIETHLALGNTSDAERSMRRYLERYADGKGAAKYQRWLERRGDPAPEP